MWPALLALVLQAAWLTLPAANGAETSVQTKATLPPAPPLGPTDAHITSAQCAACHQTVAGLTHPVQVRPTMTVPATLPLEGGQVTCTTCHQDTYGAHAQAGGPLLRLSATGQSFCIQCHTQTSITRQARHPAATSQAHLLWPKDAAARAPASSPPPDDGLTTCLACHDGVIAPDAFASLAAATTSRTGAGRPGHPVGVAYPGATLRAGDAVFKARIDDRVRLTAGQVTCNACHSLYSAEPGLLVMRNDHSMLCTSCHAQ